jgi:outer membrane protein assembly factor BamB
MNGPGNCIKTVLAWTFLFHTVTTGCKVADQVGANDSHNWPFRTEREIFSLPVCHQNNIYFGAGDGNFYCINKTSAALQWKSEGYIRVDSDPIAANGNVFFASVEDRVYALSARDGARKWATEIPGVGYSNPKMRGTALLISAARQLVEMNPENGKIEHRYRLEGQAGDFAWNPGGVAVVVNRNISANDYQGNGEISFFKHGTDSALWTAPLGGSCLGRVFCDTSRCYVGARDGVFSAFNTLDGRAAWRIDCSQLFSQRGGAVWADNWILPTPNTDSVLFTVNHQDIQSASLLICASKTDGKIRWKVEHPMQIGGAFALVRNTVIAVTQDRKLITVDVATGDARVLDLLPTKERGEFVGIKRDGDFLFIVGADACVWRLALAEVMGSGR